MSGPSKGPSSAGRNPGHGEHVATVLWTVDLLVLPETCLPLLLLPSFSCLSHLSPSSICLCQVPSPWGSGGLGPFAVRRLSLLLSLRSWEHFFLSFKKKTKHKTITGVNVNYSPLPSLGTPWVLHFFINTPE